MASTGRELWATRLPGQSSFTSPPTAYDGVVYATGAGVGGSTVTLHGPDVYARGASGDAPVILSKQSGALAGTFASATTPAFDATSMYTLQNGRLVASAPSGSPNHWIYGNGTLVMAPVVNAGVMYVGSKNGTVYGVSAKTGKKLWSGTAGSSSPPGPG